MINRYPPVLLAEDFLTHEKCFSLKKVSKSHFCIKFLAIKLINNTLHK